MLSYVMVTMDICSLNASHGRMHRALLSRETGDDGAVELSEQVRLDKVNGWRVHKRYTRELRVANCMDIDTEVGRYLLVGFGSELVIADAAAEGENMKTVASARQSASNITVVEDVLWYPGDRALFLAGTSSPGDGGRLQVWDTGSMTCISSYETGIISSMAMSRAGDSHDLVAVTSNGFGDAVCLLDLQSGAFAQRINGVHDSVATATAFSPCDEYLLASAASDGSLVLWDIRKAGPAACVHTFDGSKIDGPKGYGNLARGYLSKRPRKRRRSSLPIAHPERSIKDIFFTASGRYLVSSSQNVVLVWDVVTGLRVSNVSIRASARGNTPLRVAMTLDPNIMYISVGRTIAIYETLESEPLRYFGGDQCDKIKLLKPGLAREELFSCDIEGEIISWSPF